jgi:long-chain acyl-CoA synthetase
MWTVADLVETVARRGDDAVLAVVRGESVEALSGRDLADLVRRLARGLRERGIAAGDPVFLIGPNSAPWVIVRLATALIGALPVAADDQSSAAEIASMVADSGPRIAFASAAHAQHLRNVDTEFPLYKLDEDGAGDGAAWRDLLAAEPLAEQPALTADAPAMIVYTSGTTGAPKSFALTNANMAANVEALLTARVIGPSDRVLLPLPLHHVFPLLVGMLTTLATGATLVFPAAPTGPQIAAALRLAKVTVIVGVPRLYSALLGGVEARVAARGGFARALFGGMLAVSVAARRRGLRIGRALFGKLHAQVGPDLRLMVSGGAKLEATVIWQLEGLGWEVLSGYGLAETASMFTGNLPARKRIGSEGRPLGAGEIRIAEPDAEGVGEIQLRGANVFAGYRDNPAANQAAFTPDGWFRTGDLGTLDAERFLTVTGRLKEQLVLGGGKKIMPEELERHYAAAIYIQEVAVLEREGKLVALVVPDAAALRAAGMTRPEDAVRVALAEQAQSLPAYQRVAGFALSREPLPRTRLGKYQRFLLPKLYDAVLRGETRERPKALSPEDLALVGVPPASEIWALLSSRYADKGITLDSNLALDLGLDSLEWMTVTLELEARLKMPVTEDMIAEAATVRDLIAVITAALDAEPGSRPAVSLNAAALDVEHWVRPTGPALVALGLLLYGINWLTMRLMFRLRATGQENIPNDGPFILIANHASDLDPLAIAAALSWWRLRRIYWAGDIGRLFQYGWQRLFARASHMFPVNERSPASTLGNAKTVLGRGRALVWFPESWRTPNGEMQRFLPGIGLLLSDRPVAVVPAYVDGSFAALPRTARWPRPHPIRVRFGPPISADTIRALTKDPEPVQRIVALLQSKVADLEPHALGSVSKAPHME